MFYTSFGTYVTIFRLPSETLEISHMVNVQTNGNMRTLLDYSNDQPFMQLALDQAKQACALGEVPVGAVLVREGQVVATGFNRREIDQDPTAHAEMLVLRQASSILGSWRLNNTTLYVTLEPCAMCAGALIQARVSRLVFGTFDPKAGACGSICDLPAEPRFNHQVIVDSGLLAKECSMILQIFFQQLRQTNDVPCP